MATKEYCLPFNDNPNIVAANNTSNDQFNNLNLNQSFQHSTANQMCTKNVTTNDSKKVQNYALNKNLSDLTDINNSQTQKYSIPSQNFNNKLPSNYSSNDYGSEKEELPNKNNSSAINSSTLSLHISAYENSIELSSSDLLGDNESDGKKDKESGLSKQKKNAKQIFNGLTSSFQNLFEIPRQQKEEDITAAKKPEIMAFKATQQLFNPNQPLPSLQEAQKRMLNIFKPNKPRTEKDEQQFEEFIQSASKLAEKKKNEIRYIPFDLDAAAASVVESIASEETQQQQQKEDIELLTDDEKEMQRKILSRQAKKLYKENYEQQEVLNQQHVTIEKELKPPYLSIIDEIFKIQRAEEKEPLHQFRELSLAHESLKSGIKMFKENHEHYQRRHEKTIEKLQKELKKAKEKAAARRAVNNSQSLNAIVQKQTSFNEYLSNNNPPMKEEHEEDEEKAMLKAKIFQLNKIHAKLTNTKRIFTMEQIGFGGAICYELLDDAILIIKKLEYNTVVWLADARQMNFEFEGFQLCITKEFHATSIDLSPIIPRIFYCNITKLCLTKITITHSEYKKIVEAGKIEFVQFQNFTVKDEDGNDIDVADIIKELPIIETFRYFFKDRELTPCQKFAALPAFPKLRNFQLMEIEEDFDFKIFAEFIDKHITTEMYLSFYCSGDFYVQLCELASKEIFPALQKPRENVELSKCK